MAGGLFSTEVEVVAGPSNSGVLAEEIALAGVVECKVHIQQGINKASSNGSMLELLILLPFIMMTILSMTFQVSVDELYNASRGNYFKYSAPEIDHHYHHSGREKIIYLNRIITKLGEEMIIPAFLSLDYGCSCALTKEDCSSNQVFNPTTCRCEHQPTERAEDTRKASDAIGCNCICPLHISQIYSTDPFFHPESHQYVPSDSFSGSRNRRPPV